MKTTLDIAAALAAIIWPAVVLVLLLKYRDQLTKLAENLAPRVTKLGLAGVTIELATAKQSESGAADMSSGLNLLAGAGGMNINDSTRSTFVGQFKESSTADFAAVQLGSGHEWLSSRLYIMSILYAQMKNIKAFVFLTSTAEVGRRYFGWAEPSRIRRSLANRYPWLEGAYAEAYASVVHEHVHEEEPHTERLRHRPGLDSPEHAVAVLVAFLERIQEGGMRQDLDGDPDEWVHLRQAERSEHAAWIDGLGLEQLLGESLHTAYVSREELRGKNGTEQVGIVLAVAGSYVAIVDSDRRFDSLVDRNVLLQEVAKRLFG